MDEKSPEGAKTKKSVPAGAPEPVSPLFLEVVIKLQELAGDTEITLEIAVLPFNAVTVIWELPSVKN